jgi:FAD binding domain
VTVGAGHDFANVFQFAEANNITVVGGSALSVGAAGGWLTGGGHSAISNNFGLGVDNALQIKAVLPNGKGLDSRSLFALTKPHRDICHYQSMPKL